MQPQLYGHRYGHGHVRQYSVRSCGGCPTTIAIVVAPSSFVFLLPVHRVEALSSLSVFAYFFYYYDTYLPLFSYSLAALHECPCALFGPPCPAR